jgi:hypothetical protein
MTIDDIGGRRFVLCVGCSTVCSILLWFGKLSDSSFVTIISGTVLAYVGADTFQRHGETRADLQKTIAQAQSDAVPAQKVQQVPS